MLIKVKLTRRNSSEKQPLAPIFVHAALDDLGLTAAQFRVYGHVVRRAGNGTRECFEGVEKMGKVCRLDPDTVKSALAKLVELGLLSMRPRSGFSNVYTVTPVAAWKVSPLPNDRGGVDWEGTPPKGQGSHPPETTPPEVTPLKLLPKVAPSGSHATMGRRSRPVRLKGSKRKPASEEEFDEWVEAQNYDGRGDPNEVAATFYEEMVERNWTLPNGNPVRDWRKLLDGRLQRAGFDSAMKTPTLEEVSQFGASLEWSRDECEKFFNFYESTGWVRINGARIHNWKAAMQGWMRNPQFRADNRKRRSNGFTPPGKKHTVESVSGF